LIVVRVTFITEDGARVVAEGAEGARLLEVGQAAGMPLEGTCEGQMACSTCHVVVAGEWFDRLKPASADEEDMLDLAAGVTRTSRLSCQIALTSQLDGLEVHIPVEARDMQLR
jgi:ferredoxin